MTDIKMFTLEVTGHMRGSNWTFIKNITSYIHIMKNDKSTN